MSAFTASRSNSFQTLRSASTSAAVRATVAVIASPRPEASVARAPPPAAPSARGLSPVAGKRTSERLELCRLDPDVGGADVLLQVRHGRRSRYRERPRRAREHPGERELAGRGAAGGSRAAKPSAGSREIALGERRPGNEGDPALLAGGEHVLGGAVGEAVAVLRRRDRNGRERSLEPGDAHVADPDPADLALRLKLGEGAERLLEGYGLVHRVELVEVDASTFRRRRLARRLP